MPHPLQPQRPVRLASEMTKYALAIVVSVHTKTGSFKTWNAVAITKISLHWHFFIRLFHVAVNMILKSATFQVIVSVLKKGSNQRFL